MRTILKSSVMALLALMAATLPSEAAVRICQAPVSSGIASDVVEAKARAKALLAWTAKARTAGTSAPNWRIAGQKILRCARVANGNFDCLAFAQPCTISQVPRPGPFPAPVPRRGKVKDKPIAT
ncbi:MAG: hypothetical protein ABL908_13070 [Hyphomicrobium sp.]